MDDHSCWADDRRHYSRAGGEHGGVLNRCEKSTRVARASEASLFVLLNETLRKLFPAVLGEPFFCPAALEAAAPTFGGYPAVEQIGQRVRLAGLLHCRFPF